LPEGDGPTRLSADDAQQYWKALHESGAPPLAAVLFPGKGQLLNEFFDRVQKYAMRRALREVVGNLAGRAVLDVGSGWGRWLEFYSSLGAKAIGIDVAPAAVDAAKHRGYDARLASADSLPFETASFDVVSEVVVLLHLPAASQFDAVREMERVCRPGGHIVMLDITAGDESAHVFPRSLDQWASMFHESTIVYAENHYFAWPLRYLWRSRAMTLQPSLVRLLENLSILAAIPLEFLAMQVFHSKAGSRGLQHLMIFRRAL
jgi:ubiquinone/menaquinone biosynthesis C-methylase UbiE